MNAPEPNRDTMADSRTEDLRAEVQSLRAMLCGALLLMFIFTFCVNYFLSRQDKSLGMQLANDRQIVGSFENGGGPARAAEFLTKLNDYARSHPDFMPILQKYSSIINIRTNSNPAAVKK